MKKKSFLRDIYALIPIVLSGLLCIALVFFLWQRLGNTPNFDNTLESVSNVFIGISGFLSAIIMIYLAMSALGLKNTRNQAIESLTNITQKMHHFRSIIEILLNSKIWMPGLKEYIDEEYAGLTFFEMKEFYKGKSKLAIEFLQESHPYDDTEKLYLELKSLMMNSPKDKRNHENAKFPKMYNKEIVEKWLEHKSGSGLWYYFGYKYADFKDSLDINSVFERHQEKIMTLANTIDGEAFEDSSFNEIFLSRLGEYMANQVIPKLFDSQGKLERRLPSIMSYLYLIFLLLILFGILLPLLYILFALPIMTLVVSFAFVISTIFFIAISFYQFISREINS